MRRLDCRGSTLLTAAFDVRSYALYQYCAKLCNMQSSFAIAPLAVPCSGGSLLRLSPCSGLLLLPC